MNAVILCILGLLWGCNILNKASFMLMLLFVFVMTVCVLRRKKFGITKSGILLIFTLTSYALISSFYNEDILQSFITYLILPMMAYYTGYLLNDSVMMKEKAKLDLFVFSVSAGFAIYGMLNIYSRYQMGYNLLTWVAAGRLSIDFWRGNDVWPTLEATYFLPIVGIAFYMLVIVRGICKKIIFGALFVLALFCSLDVGSRTIIVLGGLIFIFCIYKFLTSNKVKASRKKRFLFLTVLLLTLVIILFINDVWSIRTRIMESSFILRLTGGTDYDDVDGLLSSNGRFIRYFQILEQAPTHLFGNIDLGGDVLDGGLGSGHNTWLDIYRVAGIIPFTLFLVWTVVLLKKAVRLYGQYGLFSQNCSVVLLILFIVEIQFLSESMFVLNTHLLNFYFLLAGFVEHQKLLVQEQPV